MGQFFFPTGNMCCLVKGLNRQCRNAALQQVHGCWCSMVQSDRNQTSRAIAKQNGHPVAGWPILCLVGIRYAVICSRRIAAVIEIIR